LSAFEGVCSQLLEDIQERFVYRTLIYIREEIMNYNPSPGDLSYPEKLEIMEQIAEKIKKTEQSSDSEASLTDSTRQANKISPADAHGMWYPTLKRSLICLSKLYRCLDVIISFLNAIFRQFKFFLFQKKIFEGLAQETLSMCVLSLTKASETIKKNKVNLKFCHVLY
jgi:hypothetical protein